MIDTRTANGSRLTKAERLLWIINILKTGQVVTIQRIIVTFGVTERTVYRDLRSLSRMGMSVSYDNGYRLAEGKISSEFALHADEITIVRRCLRAYAISQPAHTAERCRHLEEKLRMWIHGRKWRSKPEMGEKETGRGQELDHVVSAIETREEENVKT